MNQTGILVRCKIGNVHQNVESLPYSDPVFMVATCLDPNYQLMWMDVELKSIPDSDRGDLKDSIKGIVYCTGVKDLIDDIRCR